MDSLEGECLAALKVLGGEARAWRIGKLVEASLPPRCLVLFGRTLVCRRRRVSDRQMFDVMEVLAHEGRVSRLRVTVAPPEWLYRLRDASE